MTVYKIITDFDIKNIKVVSDTSMLRRINYQNKHQD